MNHRPWAALALLVTSLAGCDPEAEPEYLFGADDDEIAALAARYEVDEEALRRQLTAPLDCAELGQLCQDVGADDAGRLLEEALEMARDGLPREELEAQTMAGIDAAEAARPEPEIAFRSYYEFTYYSSGGTDYRFVLSAWTYNILFTKYHKAKVVHHTKAVDGTWHTSPTNLYLHLEGNRLKNGDLTTKTCSKAEYDDMTSCYRTFSTGGTQWGTATATINGHTGTNDYED